MKNSKRANRWVYHQIKRIKSGKYQGESLVRIIHQLIRSRSFQVMFFNKVFPGWYWRFSVSHALKLFNRVTEMCWTNPTDVELKRVYIPKGATGKTRPLGVPTPGWRVYSAMWGSIVEALVVDKMPENQHGFVPERGIHTAWLEILKSHIQNEDIFEYDLASFFNTVDQREFQQDLLRMGIPVSMASYLYLCNQSKPSSIKMDSSEPVENMFEKGTDPELNSTTKWYDLSEEARRDSGYPYMGFIVEETYETVDKGEGKFKVLVKTVRTPITADSPSGEEAAWAIPIAVPKDPSPDYWGVKADGTPNTRESLFGNYFKHLKASASKVGFPQGLNWSPLFAIMAIPFTGMTHMNVQKPGHPKDRPWWTGFADDGIYSGTLPGNMAEEISNLEGFRKHGLKLATKPGAVGFVKRDGV
jgi:hypothetical protein